MRLSVQALLAAAVAGAALWWGGTNLAVAVREREPLELSCADYEAQRPDAHWLRLTGCAPDLDDAGTEVTSESRSGTHVTGSDHVTAVYIPLRPAGATKGRAHIVVRRTDPGMIYLATHRRGDASYDEVAGRARDSFAEPTQGLIEPAASWSNEQSAVLDTLNLASDAVLVERDARPPFVFALVICALGLGAAAWFAWLVRQLLR
jgi:hypothetical protein